MSEISLNGNKYNLKSEGEIKVKNLKSPDEVKNDYNDDIVVENKDKKLLSISADELDIQGSWMKPYVGLPKVGTTISLFADDQKVEGKVVFSEDENDAVTYTQKMAEEGKQAASQKFDQIATNTNQLVQKTKEELNKAIEASQSQPKEENKVLKEVKQDLNEVKKEISKEVKQVQKEISKNEPQEIKDAKKEISKAVNSTKTYINDKVEDLKNNTLTIGAMDTHKKGDFDVSVTAAKNSTINANYTFAVKKLDEHVNLLGNDGFLNEPSSEVTFVAHKAGISAGANQISVGYRAHIGMEFNRPFKNDFSFSAFAGPEAGIRPKDGAAPFVGIVAGLEGRYQVDDKFTIFGGPVARGTIAGDPGKGKGVGLEAGVNFKF